MTSDEVFVSTVISNYVPEVYTKQTSNSILQLVRKGQAIKLVLRPRVLNEHAENSFEIMGTVKSGVIAGQIFRASKNNINGLILILQSAGGSAFDDFESYSNDAALQIVYVKGGTESVTLETTIVNAGSKAMALPSTNNDGIWTRTISSVDYTEHIFNLEYQQTSKFVNQKVSFFIGDGTNSKSILLPITTLNDWTSFEINESAMLVTANDLTGTTPDITSITEIGFRVDKKKVGATGYIDDIIIVPPPGEVELKLWNLGGVLPVGDGSSFNLADNATQYTEIGDRGLDNNVLSSLILSLRGGEDLYDVKEFIAGTAKEMPDNTSLKIGNYYAITMHYVNTDVNIFGTDTTLETSFYTNGYAFTTSAENVNIIRFPGLVGSGQFSNWLFGIFSTQDVHIINYNQVMDSDPGNNAQVTAYFDDIKKGISNVTRVGSGVMEEERVDLDLRPPFLVDGGRFSLIYSDDESDNVTSLRLIMSYLYIPPVVNG